MTVINAHEILAYFRPEDFNFRITRPCEVKSNKKSENAPIRSDAQPASGGDYL